MLVTTEKMLLDAQKSGYAVGAFNVENMEMVQAVVTAAEELRAPVILQTTPSTVKYASLEYYFANVAVAAQKATVPVALHLDHGNSPALAMQALRVGYTSVMIDGSQLSFEENIAWSDLVVRACSPSCVPVEAELGKVGGKEDDLVSDGGYTDPQKAQEFVERTHVNSLAVAIGTAHGVYAGEPKLDVNRLKEIRKVVAVPLVLHGASGLSREAIEECITEGICKVNFATELRIAYTEAVKEYLKKAPQTIDVKKYSAFAREQVKQLVMNRILVCGCNGKA